MIDTAIQNKFDQLMNNAWKRIMLCPCPFFVPCAFVLVRRRRHQGIAASTIYI
jgi:hypothetical protein